MEVSLQALVGEKHGRLSQELKSHVDWDAGETGKGDAAENLSILS